MCKNKVLRISKEILISNLKEILPDGKNIHYLLIWNQNNDEYTITIWVQGKL